MAELIFEEDDLEKVAALKAKYAQYTDPDYPILQVAEYYRDGVILQRNHPVQVWGHANRGVKVTVTLDGVTRRRSLANDLEQWSVTFPARKASAEPITLDRQVQSWFHSRTVQKHSHVGDVWYLTGSTLLSTSEWPYDRRDKEAELPRSDATCQGVLQKDQVPATFATPRKRRFETGGGKYRSHWLTADFSKEGSGVTMFAYEFAKALKPAGDSAGLHHDVIGARGAPSTVSPHRCPGPPFQGVRNVKPTRPSRPALRNCSCSFPAPGWQRKLPPVTSRR